MNSFRSVPSLVCVAASSIVFAQSSEVAIQSPKPPPVFGHVLKPFHMERRMVAPVRLTNSPRLESLVRSGNLYLSVDDVIALVLENNLDIAVQRYSPFLAREVLRRTEGGGLLRSVDTPIAAGPTSVSTAGISVNANGLAGGAALSSGGGIVTQIGPVPPSLDPQLYIGEFARTSDHARNEPVARPDLRSYNGLPPVCFPVLSAVHHRHVGATYILRLSQPVQNTPVNLFNPSITGYLDLHDLPADLCKGSRSASITATSASPRTT